MNASKTMLAAIGGVAAVAILTAGYFAWSAYSEKTVALEGDEDEGTDGLETVLSKAETLSRKSVYPCRESVVAVESNESAVASWKEEALRLASRGDRTYKTMTASELKSFFEADAKRMLALTGGVLVPGVPNTVLIKPGFDFGPFKEFIVEGKMPLEDAKKIAKLRRQWDDMATITEVLSSSGAVELTAVRLNEKTADEPQPEKGRRKAVKSVKKSEAPVRKEPAVESYVFTFRTQPAGLVKLLNALETSERFVVVEDFTFARENDAIAIALGGESAKREEQQTTGRRRRRGAAARAQVVEQKDESRGNLITDPLTDSPLKVEMTVAVYDFRSLEEEVAK